MQRASGITRRPPTGDPDPFVPVGPTGCVAGTHLLPDPFHGRNGRSRYPGRLRSWDRRPGNKLPAGKILLAMPGKISPKRGCVPVYQCGKLLLCRYF